MVLELKSDNQTIINDVNFEYTIFIDDVNKSIISLAGNSALQTTLLSVGNKISIYRDGILDFVGKINSSGNAEGNSQKLIIRGEEEEYIKDKIDITAVGTNGVWKNTASATIIAAILDTGVNYSAGTIDAGADIDFRVANSDSKMNSIMNAINKVGQFKFVDYINQEIDSLNSIGIANVDTLNEGTDFTFLIKQESEAKAKKVIVYGKGDGEFQIIATATSGGYSAGDDNTETFNDPTIVSTSEAQQRADTELARLEQNVKVYQIPVENPFKTYNIGDTLTINAPSYQISSESVKIVSIKRGRRGSNQFLNIEVTNTEFAKTLSSTKQKLAQQASENRNKQTYMQGSGNTLTFGPGALNCTSAAPLRLIFSLPDEFIKDEVDNIRVNTFTVDYDIDPYRKGIGTAELTDDGDIDGTTIDDAPPVVGETADAEIGGYSGGSLQQYVDTDLSYTADTSYSERCSITLDKDYDFVVVKVYFNMDSATTNLAAFMFRVQIDGTTYIHDNFITWTGDEDEYSRTYVIAYTPNSSGDDVDLDVKKQDAGDTVEFDEIEIRVSGFLAAHEHTAGLSLDTDDHGHAAGLPSNGIYLDAGGFNSDFEIGDDVSDAASLNSTEVDIYLDFWSGAAWVNKHSILNTGKTKDTEVDISDSGTYPDASGLWRVRIVPDSADADLVIGSINVKHNLDN